jgi:hypothetical protein
VNELGQGGSRSLGPSTRQAGQAAQDGVRLLEADIGQLATVAGVPAQRSSPKPPRVVDEEEDELERIREADEVELGCRRGRDRRVP